MAQNHPGQLIIFEGIDGVGKTTQLELANQVLEKQGVTVQTRRNLGGTPIGEELRNVMLLPLPRPTETNLYISVAIQEALIRDVAAARSHQQVILMDRGPLSLAAYEVFGSGLEADLGWKFVDDGMQRLQPDLVIVYTADTGRALERAKANASKLDYFESKPLDYFERVASGYQAALQRYGGMVQIDANQSIESVHEQTMAAIEKLLKPHSSH